VQTKSNTGRGGGFEEFRAYAFNAQTSFRNSAIKTGGLRAAFGVPTAILVNTRRGNCMISKWGAGRSRARAVNCRETNGLSWIAKKTRHSTRDVGLCFCFTAAAHTFTHLIRSKRILEQLIHGSQKRANLTLESASKWSRRWVFLYGTFGRRPWAPRRMPTSCSIRGPA